MAPIVRRAVALWLPAAVGATLVASLVYVSVQQSYRMGANDPQLQMAQDAGARLSAGETPEAVASGPTVDLATSLAPYVIVYGSDDRILASTGTLEGSAPTPPPGVLQTARDQGTDMVTWQPRAGVRQALEVVSWASATGSGTVLAGRSLTEVERRESDLTLMVGVGWIVIMGAIAAAALLGDWLLGREPDPEHPH